MTDFEALADNYKRCYGKTSLRFGSKPALIVIDVCKAYHDPSSPLYAPERFDTAVISVIRLIDRCRNVGIPVIFTSVLYENGNGGKWYSEKLPTVLCSFDKGNPFRDFADGVKPRQDEVVITKQYASSFFGTTLSSLLTSWGVDSTIICGYSTSGCVRATALDSMQYGFSPFVVKEACGDRHELVHESNLFDMNSKFAEVVSEKYIISLIGEMSKPKSRLVSSN